MKNFFLIVIAIVVALFASEGLVRAFYPQQMTGSIKALSSMGYAMNRSDGVIACQQGTQHSVHYYFYPPGLRGTKMDHNVTHILALGDSVTFGWILSFHDTYVYQLQQSINQHFGKNKYQLLNAGSGNWGLAEFLGYLRQYGARTNPKYVLVFLDSDDVGRAVALDIFRTKNNNSYDIVDHFHPFPHARLKNFLDKNNWYNYLLEHSQLFQLIRNVFVHMQANARDNQVFMDAHQHLHHPWHVFQRNHPYSAEQLKDAVALGNALFYQINMWCKAHHAKLLVVTTGYNAFYKPNSSDPTEAFLKQAPTFFSAQHISFYDIAPQFKKAVGTKPFQLPADGHPNAFGAKTIANLVEPWLISRVM